MKFTQTQIEKSIKTGRLALDRRDKFRYYLGNTAQVALLVVLAVAAVLFLTDIQISFLSIAIAVASFLGLVFAISSVVKYVDLRLAKVTTNIPEKRVRELLARFARLKKWKISNNRKSLIILKTGPGKSGNTGWGERMTLIFQGSEVWISSICDPDRRMTMRSYARNKSNVIFVRAVLAGRRVPAELSNSRNELRATNLDASG